MDLIARLRNIAPRRRTRLAVAALALALTQTGCGGDAPPTSVLELRDLARAEQLWSKRTFRNYRMELASACFCPREIAAPAFVTVNGTTIVDVRYRDGTQVPVAYWNGRLSVDSLFVRIRDALHSDFYARVELDFDAQYGHPRSAAFVAPSGIADGDMTYMITALQPLP